jgi:signal transduction histidine kinase
MIDEKGNLLFKIYRNKLLQAFPKSYQVTSQDQLEKDLKKIKRESSKDKWFIITPEWKTTVSDGSELNKHFTIFLKFLGDKYKGKTYQETAETQGATVKVNGAPGEIWTVGIQYEVSSKSIVIYFMISSLALLVLVVVVLYYFSKTLSDDISLISYSLTEIAEGEDVQLENKIAVTSNDEIGDLVVSFNKVQEREKKYVQNIKEHQKIIMERERLVSLGQMLGGITHNLKSPVASIAGFIDRLEELAIELEDTAADESVTPEDRLDIIKDLKNDLDEMKPYCSYISNLLTMVKEKAVQLNTSVNQSFTIAEVQARIMLLMNFELKNNNCVLKTELKLDPQSIIKGEINNLVQVINNIILNSIQAYEGQGGTIDLMIEKKENNKIVFTIKDYAPGIPEDVQKKLLQEMVTTKGAKGSGLGLYLSRLTIKGRFGGDLIFRSKIGEGTTFQVIIPYQPGDESHQS